MKQNWYQLEGSKLKEFITIMHIPYTFMCISFLTIGFSISGIKNWYLYTYTVIAYFMGLGISAHCFDQLQGMGSRYVEKLTDSELVGIGVWSLLSSIILGVTIMNVYQLWSLIWLIPIQTFFVFSYPLAKLFKGNFHTDFWFSVSFGAIPVIVGNYVNTSGFSKISMVWALVCFIISYIEITLSRYTRDMRKYYNKMYCNDNAVLDYIIYPKHMKKPELALKMLCILSYLIAVIMFIK